VAGKGAVVLHLCMHGEEAFWSAGRMSATGVLVVNSLNIMIKKWNCLPGKTNTASATCPNVQAVKGEGVELISKTRIWGE
jgi:hypothetical protein